MKQPPCTERAVKLHRSPLVDSYQSVKGVREGEDFKNSAMGATIFAAFTLSSVSEATQHIQSLFVYDLRESSGTP